MINHLGRLECGCPVSQRTYLYVGKHVLLRSRLQQHVFGKRHQIPSSWLTNYQEDHRHNVYYEAWYLPKHKIGTVENWMIGKFSPTYNRQQTSAGFWDPNSWVWEPPFVYGNASDITVGRTAAEMKIANGSWLKNTSGVYAFFVDPGSDILAAHEATMSLPGLRNVDWKLPPALIERVQSERLAKKALNSYPFPKRPVWIDEPILNEIP